MEAEEELYSLVKKLVDSEQRESALMELSKKREKFPDLAPLLWHSFGTITALLQEIVNIYPALHPPTLTTALSNRVCNALALLQCVASHPETQMLFLKGAQCLGGLLVKSFVLSPHPSLFISIFEYSPPWSTVRISPLDKPWCDWGCCQGTQSLNTCSFELHIG